jgi:hypothetical protein
VSLAISLPPSEASDGKQGPAVLLAGFYDLNDVRMLEARDHLRFAAGAVELFAAGARPRQENLERDPAPRSFLKRLADDRHAAGAEHTQNAVRSKTTEVAGLSRRTQKILELGGQVAPGNGCRGGARVAVDAHRRRRIQGTRKSANQVAELLQELFRHQLGHQSGTTVHTNGFHKRIAPFQHLGALQACRTVGQMDLQALGVRSRRSSEQVVFKFP